MKTEARDIDREHLVERVNTEYGLDISALAFLPKGEDAYCYVAGDQQGRRYFIRGQDSGAGLEPAYRALSKLHNACSLAQVVAPYATTRGTFTCRYGRYRIAVFPFVEGRSAYEDGLSESELAQAATLLASVHKCTQTLTGISPEQERFEHPFREPILRALKRAGETLGSKAYEKKVLTLLQAEREDILVTLERMEGLKSELLELEIDWVLTHGDPNLDNFLKDNQGLLYLTDWGEIALGPPERDLFAFTGEHFEPFLKHYVYSWKRPRVHPEIFAFYFYRWSLQEIADYATRILFQSLGPVEDAHAWSELQDYLPIRHDDIAAGLREVENVLNRVLGTGT